ncbi:TQO small subunit DoxD [Pleomorphovibrio marinus]|uniref:TQO small subunit DoxD n=1 Tax=Pleomorphovibrio marinus TaxID=2164132 RepID=UPI000E0A3E28|nr:TQO small subunit DoxD [Pleomorphovibrio marinus]
MKSNTMHSQPNIMAGMITLSLRLVIGWTYFSAFWRRLVLENKLDPEGGGYIGEKFNHFLPNALGIQGIIEYLVSNPSILWWFMTAFTIIEGVVGLFMMLGLFTRLMSIMTMGLATGILLGAGWLGTTCLDEWQIGVLGIAAGFTLFLSGSGIHSLDHKFVLQREKPEWLGWVSSGPIPLSKMKVVIPLISLGIFFFTLYSNQYFHGGVYGKLHNKSVKPKVEISKAVWEEDQLQLELMRVEGADVYGSFLIRIEVLDAHQQKLLSLGGKELSELPESWIHNEYVAQIKPGKYSLELPLGAKAVVKLPLQLMENKENLRVKLIDISGAEWYRDIHIP